MKWMVTLQNDSIKPAIALHQKDHIQNQRYKLNGERTN